MPTAVILLAAGQGSRMNSDLPKVLHPLAGAPLIAHALAAARSLAPERLVVVTGHGAAEVEAAVQALDPEARLVNQAEQRGTGHAKGSRATRWCSTAIRRSSVPRRWP
jgi:bifunctional UDP-N-acetylglucosamine pyrophosphorylase/glucosamine-1-phosphate N-acetyltransferase